MHGSESEDSSDNELILPSILSSSTDQIYHGPSRITVDDSQPSTSQSSSVAGLNFGRLDASKKKALNQTYLDRVLSPHYNNNKHPSEFERRNISSETDLPLYVINEWYAQQRRKWMNGGEKRMRIKKYEGELLKCFNEDTLFTGEGISDLMKRTGLHYDEIGEWYNVLRKKLDKFHSECPNPNHAALWSKSRQLGVKFETLKKWGCQECKSLPKIEMREKTRNVDKTNGNKNKSSTVSKWSLEKEKDNLSPFYFKNPVPSTKLIVSIARMLRCFISEVKQWFSLMRANHGPVRTNDAENVYEIAKRVVEGGFDLEKTNLHCFDEKQPHFREDQVEFLNEFFYKDPYPSKRMIMSICVGLGCRYEKVFDWFVRNRLKMRAQYTSSGGLSSSVSRTPPNKNNFEEILKDFLKTNIFMNDANDQTSGKTDALQSPILRQLLTEKHK